MTTLTVTAEQINVVVSEGVKTQSDLQVTTMDLVNGSYDYEAGVVITTSGFYEAGDGGGAQWKVTETSGLTPSQTPADRKSVELVDGEGRLLSLSSSTVDARALGSDYGKSIAIGVSSNITVEVNEEVTASIQGQDVDSVMQGINLVIANRLLTIKLPSGEHSMSDFVDVNNATGGNIIIDGLASSNVTVNSIGVLYSESYNHMLELSAPSHGLQVGDYFYVNTASLSGTGRYKEIAGCWKVASVEDSNTLRIKHTHAEGSFPSMTVSFTARPLKTILSWSGARGFSVTGSRIKMLSNVCLVGDFDISTELPSDGPFDGLQVGDQANSAVTGSSQSESHYSGDLFCQRVGVSGWRNNGVQVLGGSLKTNGFSVSSCGHRGIQSASNGYILSKFSSASGNASSGFEAEAGGVLNAAGGISCGNGEQGVYTIASGNIVFSSASYSGGNLSYGLDARDGGFISANTSEVSSNGIGAINANLGAVTIENGVVNGVVNAAVGGTIQMKGATGSATVSKDSSSTVIMFSGKEFGGWDEFTPSIKNVTYTDGGSIGYFRESGGIANFIIDVNYSGLDTSDNSTIVFGDFPSPFNYSYGQASINTYASTGYAQNSNETFDAKVNTQNSEVLVVADSSGSLDGYNDGRIQASGRIVISGWVKTEL